MPVTLVSLSLCTQHLASGWAESFLSPTEGELCLSADPARALHPLSPPA